MFFTDTTFEPKRKFRFTMVFSEQPDITFMCTKAGKPSYTLEATPHRFLNHEYKFPNIVKWQDVNVSFVDARDTNDGFRFFNMLQQAGYQIPSGLNADNGIGLTKESSTNALGSVYIRQLDGGARDIASDLSVPGGMGAPHPAKIVDQFELKNAFISSVKWGELDYSQDALVNIDITIKYDYANFALGPGD